MNYIKNFILKFFKRREGLIDLSDDRNFGSRALYKPTKEDLAIALSKTFIVYDPKRVDQLDSDYCVGEGGAYEASATENFEQGSGAFVFACAKRWSRASISAFGTSLLAGCMARLQYGVCRRELYEYKMFRRDWYANFANIPEVAFKDAEKHKCGSVWELDVPWGFTKFESIVATLYHLKDKKVLIGTGNNAHRITVIGYSKEKDSLICADTYGTKTYDNGTRYVSRYEAGTLFTPYFVLDLERSLAEILVKYNSKVVKLVDSADCYYVSNGTKHLIPSELEAWSNGFLLAPFDEGKLTEEIARKDFDKIPLGEDVKFEGGKYEWIVRRIYEKNGLALKLGKSDDVPNL